MSTQPLKQDSVINVINNGIKHDIQVSLEHKSYRGALIQIYAAIDAMAYLGLPESQDEVKGQNFIDWAEKYILRNNTGHIKGIDFWGARCALLHTYGAASIKYKNGKCIAIGYRTDEGPLIAHPSMPDLVVISIPLLARALFEGIDNFLIDVFSDKKMSPIIERRFQSMVHIFEDTTLNRTS